MSTVQLVRLRNGRSAVYTGKGILGRVTVGYLEAGKIICWNLDGRWRWDGQDHPLDIIWEN